jgi:hypothetical protein
VRPAPAIVDTFEIAGVACGVDCRHEAFWALLSPRYRDFASSATPELSLRVDVVDPPSDTVAARWSGPFARFGATNGTLSIEGAAFRGSFDERSGCGWIVQPLDPTPFEIFLTAIYAGRLLRASGFFLHAAAIVGPAGACVFFGPSESGKTTVADLVAEGVITDETTAIRRDGDGYVVSGVPWRGRRLTAPLAGLFRLRRARTTSFVRMSPAAAVRELLPSVLFSRADPAEIDRFLEIAGGLARRVPYYEMHFTPDRSFWEMIPGLELGERHDLPV